MLAFSTAVPSSSTVFTSASRAQSLRSAAYIRGDPSCTALQPQSNHSSSHPARLSVKMTATSPKSNRDVRVRLFGNNIAITDSLRNYVDAKIAKIIRKYANYCTKADVHLTFEHNPAIAARNAAEVVIFAGKTILRRQVRAVDMYEAIDQVEDMISRTLRKYKERKESDRHVKMTPVVDFEDDAASVILDASEGDTDSEEADNYASVPAHQLPKIEGLVKRKVFPLPPQTVEEALLCLEYIDHSFYLFRMKDSGKVALVYRRNHGGYGLIEPDNMEGAIDNSPFTPGAEATSKKSA